MEEHPTDLKGNNDILWLTRPDVVREIHEAYLEAGADIVETNTFTATSIAQADYGLGHLAYEINVAAAEIARGARGRDRSAIRSGCARRRHDRAAHQSLSFSPKVDDPSFRAVTFDEVQDRVLRADPRPHRRRRRRALARDDVRHAQPQGVPGRPRGGLRGRRAARAVMISVTIIDKSGRTLSGQLVDAWYASITTRAALGRLELLARRQRDAPVCRRAGRARDRVHHLLPERRPADALGEFDEPPEITARLLRELAEAPRQPRRRLLRDHARSHPRDRARRGGDEAAQAASAGSTALTRFTGLEALTIRPDSNFLMIGERTNVTGSAKFAELVKKGDYQTGTQVALDQVNNGANIIDVNMDEGMLDGAAAMTTFLNIIATEPDIARVPVMIDSSK